MQDQALSAPTPTSAAAACWDWANAQDWQGRRALVLGAGESGLATAQWLASRGMTIRLVDSRSDLPLAQSLAQANGQVELLLGQPMPFSPQLLRGVDLLVPSPGLSPIPDRPQSIAALLQAARQQGLAMASELDLFDWALEQDHQAASHDQDGSQELALARPVVLAVTGSNGKTTTAKLCAHLLASIGLDVELAGNVSPSLLQALQSRQARHQPPKAWILELSSFQLAFSSRFSPTAASVLNLSQDHLDWHLDYDDYAQSKLRVFGLPQPTATIVLNRDDEPLARRISAMRSSVSSGAKPRRTRAQEDSPGRVSFGSDRPASEGPSFGVLREALDWLAFQPAAWTPGDEPPPLVRLMPAQALRLRGAHHWLNAQAALALCLSVTDDLAGLLFALREYQGEAHRMQTIATARGIEFVDDSKGTNVGATVAALRGDLQLTAVILGGQGKGQSFEELAEVVSQTGAHGVCIGEAGPEIMTAIVARGGTAEPASDMADAVQKASSWILAQRSEGQSTGRVLLSPACASFDLFQNYADRARVFVEVVGRQIEQWGEPC